MSGQTFNELTFIGCLDRRILPLPLENASLLPQLSEVGCEVFHESIKVWYSTPQFLGNIGVLPPLSFPALEMQFEFDTDILSSVTGRSMLPTFTKEGKCTYVYMQGGEEIDREVATKGYTLHILWEEEYIRQKLGADFKQRFLQLNKDSPTRACNTLCCRQQIRPAVIQIIMDYFKCRLSGDLRKLYLESKITELLVLQLDGLERVIDTKDGTGLNNRDITQLEYVYGLLTNHPERSYSISQISELTGLNEFKLKMGFKALYSLSVMQFLTEVRLQKAKRMLLESDLSISEIAFSVSYKNPQHFTTAFKRKFGILPKSLRPRGGF